MKYYLLITEIEPNFTDKTIIAATSAAQALDTMKQIAAPFGYKVQDNLQQLDRDTAAEMAKQTHSIKATKTPRIRNDATADATKTPTPMKLEEKQEIVETLEKLDMDCLKCLLQYITFLTVLDQQPHLVF